MSGQNDSLFKLVHGAHPRGGIWKVKKRIRFMKYFWRWATIYQSDDFDLAQAEYLRAQYNVRD